MELRQVRYFLALCETLNFTKAARICDITQPTLTLAIQKLEEEFGGQLVHRERGNTHLTQLGELVQPLLRQVEQASRSAVELALEITSEKRVIMSLGMSECIDARVILEPMGNVLRMTPGLELRLDGGPAEAVAVNLLDGAIQLGVVDLDVGLDGRLRGYPIHIEPLRVALPRDHALTRKDSLMAEDLTTIPWIAQEGSDAHAQLIDAVRRHEPDWMPRHATRRASDALTLCQGGLGATLIGARVAPPEGVVTRTLIDPMLERTIGLIEARGRPLSGPALAFRRIVQTVGAA